jgi:hypothetical protein
MAGEIQFSGQPGETYYTLVRNSQGQVWRPATSAFEAYSAANWSNYATAASLTQQGNSGYYTGNFPTAITANGVYLLDIRRQAGAAPLESDLAAGGGEIYWSGFSEINPAREPFERATVQASPTPVANQFAGNMTLLAQDGAYSGLVAFLSGANAGLSRRVLGYTGVSRLLICEAFPSAPAVGDEFMVG